MGNGIKLLGIDIGTSFAKGVLCTPEGAVVASHVVPTGLLGSRADGMEQDPERTWWGACTTLTRALLSGSTGPEEIGAVGVCGIFPSFVALDAQWQLLSPGILYLDTRGSSEVRDLFPGCALDVPFLFAAKLAWMRAHHPELYGRVRMVLPATGYVVFRLTGEHVIDKTLAADTFLMPSGRDVWDSDACRALGLLPDCLPRVSRSFDIAGSVSREAAGSTGLREGTPVIVGTGDIAAEAVSAGIVEPNRGLLIYGSTACVVLSTAESMRSRTGLGLCPHSLPGLSLLVGATSTSGSALDWLIDTLISAWFSRAPDTTLGVPEPSREEYGNKPSIYEALNREAAALPPGSGGLMVLPHLKGSRAPSRDASARGMILGLTLSTRREQIYRAFLEGIAYDIRSIVDAMDAHLPVPRMLTATGGGRANTLLTRVVSDVLQKEQRGVRHSSAARGSACLAGLGTGLVSGTRAIKETWASPDESPIIPDQKAGSAYEGYYALFRTLQKTMCQEMATLGALAEGGTDRTSRGTA
jgi:xylulokinase